MSVRCTSIFVLFSVFCTVFASVYPNYRSEWEFHSLEKDWWQVASFYQIYPRSFQDSNGDGIGDLNGITSRLSYLKEIGINATWLSPIFKSPMADFGYDISDYFAIQPEYGTFEDFDALLKEAKRLGIKVLLDFVPNHSSDECEWFTKSVNREKGYENFYTWHPGFPDPKNASNRLPPSNWVSLFRGSAWKWNDVRKEFYLHQFLAKQPDLNYRDSKVVETMKSVLRFWLQRGVDGFRIDAVPQLFEIDRDANGNFKDEPLSGHTTDPDDYGYLDHIYTVDQNETLDMLYQWREVMDEFQRKNGGHTRVLLAESYSPIDILMKYYGDGKRNGAHLPFNFLFISSLSNSSNAQDFVSVMYYWMDHMPAGRTANWVMGNHDNWRVASRFGSNRVDLMNMVLLTLPGASVNYNGEEIGMTDVWISWKDTVDPAACNTNPSIYEKFSRDPERTPFQWDITKNAGFSNASKTWLPVSLTYPMVNVWLENSDPRSHLSIYKRLQVLRNYQTLKEGDFLAHAFNKDVFAVVRKLSGDYTIVTVANVGEEDSTVDLKQATNLPDEMEYLIVSGYSDKKIGDYVKTSSVDIKASEAFVLRSPKKLRNILGIYFYSVI